MADLPHDMNPTGRGFRIPMPVSKKFVYPEDPRPEDFDIRDIAHKLAMQARYGGGLIDYFSTAEHCVLIHDWFWKRGDKASAKAGLLHDRAEAWIQDMMRPLKQKCQPWYGAMEQRIEEVSAPVFGVPFPNPEHVMDVDYRICLDEKAQGYPFEFDRANDVERAAEPLGVVLNFWYPHIAYEEFMKRWRVHQ